MKDQREEEILLRANEAEEKFARGEGVSEEDIIAVVLAHPEKFEVNGDRVRLKEN